MTNLTFEQFLNTKNIISSQEWCEKNGVDSSTIEGDKIVEYGDGSCYVEIVAKDQYFLVIGNRFWTTSDLDSLAFILYHSWYVYECADFSDEDKEKIKDQAVAEKDNYFKGLTKEEVEEFYYYLQS